MSKFKQFYTIDELKTNFQKDDYSSLRRYKPYYHSHTEIYYKISEAYDSKEKCLVMLKYVDDLIKNYENLEYQEGNLPILPESTIDKDHTQIISYFDQNYSKRMNKTNLLNYNVCVQSLLDEHPCRKKLNNFKQYMFIYRESLITSASLNICFKNLKTNTDEYDKFQIAWKNSTESDIMFEFNDKLLLTKYWHVLYLDKFDDKKKKQNINHFLIMPLRKIQEVYELSVEEKLDFETVINSMKKKLLCNNFLIYANGHDLQHVYHLHFHWLSVEE